MSRKTILFGLAVLFVIATGCSGTGSDPASPDLQVRDQSGGLSPGNTCLWGLWDINLDPVAGTAEIVPLRHMDFTANVTRFMQPPVAATNLLKVAFDPSSDFPTGYVVVTVILTHPFPGHETFTGFDVRGMVIGNGSISGVADPDILYAGSNDLRILNADGYTRWFNAVEFTTYNKIFGYTLGNLGTPIYGFTATLNGYKYFCNNLGEEQDMVAFFTDNACPNPRGMFAAGSVQRRKYELQFPMVGGLPEFSFQYAVIASWELPDPNPPENVPDDFPLSANCQEAFCFLSEDLSYMYYEGPGNKGGSLRLVVRVFDHQGVENPDGVSGEIAAIHLETPDGMIPGNIATFDPAALADALIEEDAVSATYLLIVTSTNPSGQGDFQIMVVIESGDPDSYDQGFPAFDFPDAALAAYFPAMVTVSAEQQYEMLIAIADVLTSQPWCLDDALEFDASASYDPDGGPIGSYEWDFDGDGIFGDAYDSGTDANPTKVFDHVGDFVVDVRATDDELETDTLDLPFDIPIKHGEVWVDDDNVAGPWDGSFEHPFLTIQEGVDCVNPDCGTGWVWVLDGTYEENVVLKSGITVEGVGDPAPLIRSPDGSEVPNVSFGEAAGATLKHFQCQPRTTSIGIFIMEGSYNTVDDIEILDNPGGMKCIYAVCTISDINTTGTVINNIRTDGYLRDTCGFVRGSGHNLSITNCVLLNIFFIAPCPMGIIQVISDGEDALIANIVIGHGTMGDFISDYPVRVIGIVGGPGMTVRNNLVFDTVDGLQQSDTWAIHIEQAADMTIEHNTIAGVTGHMITYGLLATHPDADPGGVALRSNIVSDLAGATPADRYGYAGTWLSSLAADYSCAWNAGTPFTDSIVEGVGVVYDDPMYEDPLLDDYRIQVGSPCDGTAHDGTDMGAYGGSDPLTWLPG